MSPIAPKLLAELHDGGILLESRPNFGTTVTITLPPERMAPRPKAPRGDRWRKAAE